MSKNNEDELRLTLKDELEKASNFEPAANQDAIFQESLEQHLSEKLSIKKSRGFYWSVAASILFLTGITVMVINNYSNDSSGYHGSLPELITASNLIERELSRFEAENLDSEQYVEVFKLRDEISQLDNTLNELYSLNQQVPEEKLESLWARRLKATKNLKAVYTSQYRIVRI